MDASRPRTEVAVGIVIDEGRLLIARRSPHVPLGGQWEFPGGKLEPGETPEAAAEREVLEELGLTVIAVSRLAPIHHDYDHAAVTLTPILCRPLHGDARPLHCTECRWVTPADLPTYAFPAANATLLAELAALPLPTPTPQATITTKPRAISSAG